MLSWYAILFAEKLHTHTHTSKVIVIDGVKNETFCVSALLLCIGFNHQKCPVFGIKKKNPILFSLVLYSSYKYGYEFLRFPVWLYVYYVYGMYLWFFLPNDFQNADSLWYCRFLALVIFFRIFFFLRYVKFTVDMAVNNLWYFSYPLWYAVHIIDSTAKHLIEFNEFPFRFFLLIPIILQFTFSWSLFRKFTFLG